MIDYRLNQMCEADWNAIRHAFSDSHLCLDIDWTKGVKVKLI